MNIRDNSNKKVYVGITGGKLSLNKKTDETTKFAVEHFYKTSSGETKSTWKVFLWSIVGYIKDVQLGQGKDKDGKTFDQLEIHISGDEEYVLQTDPSNRYAQDFFKRARNIDYSKECFINSYDWVDKNKKGITVKQDPVPGADKNSGKNWTNTIKNYYYDEKESKWTDEIPKPEGDTSTYTGDDWKLYYLQLTKFFKGTVEAHIKPLIAKANPIENEIPVSNDSTIEEIPLEGPSDDLPF